MFEFTGVETINPEVTDEIIAVTTWEDFFDSCNIVWVIRIVCAVCDSPFK